MEEIILNRIAWIKDNCKQQVKKRNAFIIELQKMQKLIKNNSVDNNLTFKAFNEFLAKILAYNHGFGLQNFTECSELRMKEEDQVKVDVDKIVAEITEKEFVKKTIATNVMVKGKMEFEAGYYRTIKKDVVVPVVAKIYCPDNFDQAKTYTLDELMCLAKNKQIVVDKFVIYEKGITEQKNAEYSGDTLVIPTNKISKKIPLENRILNTIPQANFIKPRELFADEPYLNYKLRGLYKTYGQKFITATKNELLKEVEKCLETQQSMKAEIIKESKADILKLLFDQKHEIDSLIKAEKKFNFEK